MSDGWIDRPDRPGVWVDTGAGRVTASTWDEEAIRDWDDSLNWKFKFMGPIPDPPSNPATDAEIAAAACIYRAAKDYIAISTARGMLFNLIDRK